MELLSWVQEAVFYLAVAAWYVVVVQFNLVDQLLGGPDLSMAPAQPALVVPPGVHAADLCEDTPSAAARDSGTEQSLLAHERAGSAPAAATLQKPPSTAIGNASKAQPGEARHVDPDDTCSAGSQAPEAAAMLRPGVADLAQAPLSSASFSKRARARTLYSKVAGTLNLGQRISAASHAAGQCIDNKLYRNMKALGVETGLNNLATEVPSGIRDAGVRMVDRAEQLLRRWAVFGGGVVVLYRLLLHHRDWCS